MVEEEIKERLECMRCGFEMAEYSACHLICRNCGSELTCSDKGSFW